MVCISIVTSRRFLSKEIFLSESRLQKTQNLESLQLVLGRKDRGRKWVSRACRKEPAAGTKRRTVFLIGALGSGPAELPWYPDFLTYWPFPCSQIGFTIYKPEVLSHLEKGEALCVWAGQRTWARWVSAGRSWGHWPALPSTRTD